MKTKAIFDNTAFGIGLRAYNDYIINERAAVFSGGVDPGFDVITAGDFAGLVFDINEDGIDDD